MKKKSNPVKKITDIAPDIFYRIFNSIKNGILITDPNGYVAYMNKPYGEFLNLDTEGQIGRHCTDVVENSRLHIVGETGKSEINHIQEIKGENIVVQRIPIKRDNQVIAVFGLVMFSDLKEVTKLAKTIGLLESKVKLYEAELLSLRGCRYTFDSIIAQSQSMKRLKEKALRATANNSPVLITGECGTGSELFGYDKGAFTGARTGGKPGKFELAHRGSIFLDEIGDMPLEMQPKLLRVIEEKEFERVGGTKMIKSDFRLIAATNQNLEEMAEQGRFRRDLYYRLNVIPVNIPPLKDRPEDIPLLSEKLIERMAADADVYGNITISKKAQQILNRHHWPGNVRELSNVLERTLTMLDGKTIDIDSLPYYIRPKAHELEPYAPGTLKSAQIKMEKTVIEKALIRCDYNKAQAARELGIHRTLLYKKLKKHNIQLSP